MDNIGTMVWNVSNKNSLPQSTVEKIHSTDRAMKKSK